MKRWSLFAWLLVAAGCATSPTPPAQLTAVSVPNQPPPAIPATVPTTVPVVALLEPYLVAANPAQMVLPPPGLGGRIQMAPLPPSPLTPSLPPTQTRPLPTAPSTQQRPVTPPATSNKPSPALISAMARLLDDERGRSVDQARRQLALANTRVTQTAAEAKKTADLVRAGAVAQFKSTQADTAAREAVSEQADAQKTLDDAVSRQRDARHDVEAALGALGELPFALTQLEAPTPAFRPVPFTYRLSILGEAVPGPIKVEGGTLGRALERQKGESAAWIIRCADPSKLRLTVGTSQTQMILRSLPPTDPSLPKA